MRGLRNIGCFLAILGVILLGASVSSVAAETVSSPSYRIDGNFGGSFGGQASSTSYKMSAIGGEAIIGNGASGSYMIDQQQTSTATPNMQLTVQPSGLVGFYPMDENAGATTADASQYQNTGTISGSASWNANGKLGSAIDFNGPNDTTGAGGVKVADYPQLPSGSQMTFETWINSRDPSIQKKIVTNSSNFSNSWQIMQMSNGIFIYVADSLNDSFNNYLVTQGNFLTANTWQHLAVVYDGSLVQADKVKVYIDGVRVAAATGGTFPSTLQNSSAPLVLGGNDTTSSGAFNGSLDHVKLFNRALSANEVKAEYTAQNTGMSAGFGLDLAPGGSTTSQIDAIVRTNRSYAISIQQDTNLQSGGNSIPAVNGSIASPSAWTDGATKGFGFTLTGAPNIDSKWSSGSNYAAVPSIATTFYNGVGGAYSVVDTVNMRLRLDAPASQPIGVYGNTITYTGTMIP